MIITDIESRIAGLRQSVAALAPYGHPAFPEDAVRAYLSGALLPVAQPESGAFEPRTVTPQPTESDALTIVARCPHARVCSCVHRGYIDCQPDGKRPGERLSPATCEACLSAQ